MFALSNLRARPLSVSVKCDPELAAQLRISYPAVAPGYHLNKRHWNTITLDGSLDDELVIDMLEDSYDLVVAGAAARGAAAPSRIRRVAGSGSGRTITVSAIGVISSAGIPTRLAWSRRRRR